MLKLKKRLVALLLAAATLIGVFPISAFAYDVTMDLSKAEVSWDYMLTDEEGNSFKAYYGINAEDNCGVPVIAYLRHMHDYTAKRPGLGSDKSQWVYGRDYVYCFCIEPGMLLTDSGSYAASTDENFGDRYKQLSVSQKELARPRANLW